MNALRFAWLALAALGCGGGHATEPRTDVAPTAAPGASAYAPFRSPAYEAPSEDAIRVIVREISDHPPQGAPEPGLELRFERTPCLGNCPVYSLVARGDGTVAYHGEIFVGVRGDVRYTRSPAALVALADELVKGDYFGAEGPPGCQGAVTDQPSVKISLTRNGRTQSRSHYHGGSCLPGELRALEDRVDDVLRTAALVRCAPQCLR